MLKSGGRASDAYDTRSFKPCFSHWYKKFQTLRHSVFLNLASLSDTKSLSLGDTKVSNRASLGDTKSSNLASLGDTKSVKPCITRWYKSFKNFASLGDTISYTMITSERLFMIMKESWQYHVRMVSNSSKVLASVLWCFLPVFCRILVQFFGKNLWQDSLLM